MFVRVATIYPGLPITLKKKPQQLYFVIINKNRQKDFFFFCDRLDLSVPQVGHLQ